MDGTISKTFPIKERYKLEFRLRGLQPDQLVDVGESDDDSRASPCSARSTAQATTNRGREMQYTLRLVF